MLRSAVGGTGSGPDCTQEQAMLLADNGNSFWIVCFEKKTETEWIVVKKSVDCPKDKIIVVTV